MFPARRQSQFYGVSPINLSPALRSLVDDRAKNFGLLTRLQEIVAKSGAIDQNTAATVGQFSGLLSDRTHNLSGELATLVNLNGQITATRKNIADTKAFLAELPGLSVAAFGSGADLASVNALIAQTKDRVASLTAEWQAGKIPASALFEEINKIAAALQAVAGKDDVLKPFIDSLYLALEALPQLGTELKSLLNGLAKAQAASSGLGNAGRAFTRSTSEVPGVNVTRGSLSSTGPDGKPIPVTDAKGTLNLADIARISLRQADAIRAAADEQERRDAEASGQRGQMVNELSTTNGLFSNFAGSFASFASAQAERKQYTSTLPDYAAALNPNSPTHLPLLQSEQSLLQTKLQYQNLTPDQKSEIEHRLAEIALQIAKIGYAQERANYAGLKYGGFGLMPNIAKFASGGAFKVGGSGGTDSRLVQFLASPNEHVMVLTPTQWDAIGKLNRQDVTNIQNNTVVQNIQTPDISTARLARRQLAIDARRGMGM